MPVWPFLMAICAGFTLWGWRHNAWEIPALALCGYIAMRAVSTYAPHGYVEVIGCASWLFFAAVMIHRGGEVPGFFYALSAMTYPVLLVFGFRLEYMGLSAFIAEFFAALALLSIGGGIHGMAHTPRDSSGYMAWVKSHSIGMAARQARRPVDLPQSK